MPDFDNENNVPPSPQAETDYDDLLVHEEFFTPDGKPVYARPKFFIQTETDGSPALSANNDFPVNSELFSDNNDSESSDNVVSDARPFGGHRGHRARLIAKAQKERLSDAELLELLLFYCVRRRNTSDIAHSLIAKFGSIQAVCAASPLHLKSVKGVGDSIAFFLTKLGDLQSRTAPPPPVAQPKRGDYMSKSDVWKHLPEIYADEKREVVDVYLLDSESRVFQCVRISRGDRHSVTFQSQNLAKVLVQFQPSGIVLVHNHPFGEPEPSTVDGNMTEKCQLLCSLHNVIFCDHVICTGRGECYSYYYSGKMESISKNYAAETLLSAKAETKADPQKAPNAAPKGEPHAP